MIYIDPVDNPFESSNADYNQGYYVVANGERHTVVGKFSFDYAIAGILPVGFTFSSSAVPDVYIVSAKGSVRVTGATKVELRSLSRDKEGSKARLAFKDRNERVSEISVRGLKEIVVVSKTVHGISV